MRVRLRIAGAVALLLLPFLLQVALALWFWFDEVPEISRRELVHAKKAYRAEAVELAADSNATVVAYAKSWPRTGSVAGVPWGYVAEGGRVRVWYGAGPSVRSVTVEPAETDVTLFFGVFLVLTSVLVLLLTVLGIRFFVRLERDRRDFVAAAAHDLETPVAALGMVLENRAAGLGTDDETFAECERLAVRLGRLVDNLRDFIHRGRRGAPVLTDFDLLAAVREAYRPFAADYRDLLGEDVPIACDTPTVTIRADETFVQQILWNLFANDLKYAAPYGAVSVVLERDGGSIRVVFADKGCGLTRRERARIFDRYYRARSTMRSGKGGFGIGLCSAREFARAMGGDLTVRANQPQGCVFTLTLPAVRTQG